MSKRSQASSSCFPRPHSTPTSIFTCDSLRFNHSSPDIPSVPQYSLLQYTWYTCIVYLYTTWSHSHGQNTIRKALQATTQGWNKHCSNPSNPPGCWPASPQERGSTSKLFRVASPRAYISLVLRLPDRWSKVVFQPKHDASPGPGSHTVTEGRIILQPPRNDHSRHPP